MPALHVGLHEKFPPLDEDDLANLRKQIELFAFFVEVIPHKYQADDEGFLGTIPHEQLTTPYADRNVLEIGKGDWVVVNPAHFIPMLQEFDAQKLLDKYDDFVKYLATIPDAPRRRDDGRMLAETAVHALADLKACVAVACAQNKDALLFRLLPPPELAHSPQVTFVVARISVEPSETSIVSVMGAAATISISSIDQLVLAVDQECSSGTRPATTFRSSGRRRSHRLDVPRRSPPDRSRSRCPTRAAAQSIPDGPSTGPVQVASISSPRRDSSS